MAQSYPPILERLNSKTSKTADGCWLFTSTRGGKYGRIKFNGKDDGVHRVSWVIHNGPIPDGLWVLHKCIGHGNCWNPGHLYLGTAKQNADDRDRQGRSNTPFGERQGHTRLTAELVAEIRGPTDGWNHRQIAEMYGVSTGTVSHIRSGKAWKYAN